MTDLPRQNDQRTKPIERSLSSEMNLNDIRSNPKGNSQELTAPPVGDQERRNAAFVPAEGHSSFVNEEQRKKDTSSTKEQVKNVSKHVADAARRPIENWMEENSHKVGEYFHIISEGLRRGSEGIRSESLNQNQEVSEQVSQWFRDGAQWVEEFASTVEGKSVSETMDQIQSKGKAHPLGLFAAAMVSGFVFSRVTKYSASGQISNRSDRAA